LYLKSKTRVNMALTRLQLTKRHERRNRLTNVISCSYR